MAATAASYTPPRKSDTSWGDLQDEIATVLWQSMMMGGDGPNDDCLMEGLSPPNVVEGKQEHDDENNGPWHCQRVPFSTRTRFIWSAPPAEPPRLRQSCPGLQTLPNLPLLQLWGI